MLSETIKQHPAASLAVLAIGVIILYSLIGGSGSSAAAVQSTGPSDNLQIAEINSAAAIQGSQIQADSADRRAGLAAQLQALAISAGLLGKYSDNDTALRIAGIQSDTTKFTTQAGADVSKYQIGAQEAVALGQQRQVVDIAGITSAVNIAGINANRDVSITNTQALADANRYAAQQSAQTAQLISNNQKSVANHSSDNDLFGNILGAAGAFLSFL